MRQTVNEREETAQVLKALYAPVLDDMQRVEDILEEELRSPYAFVDHVVRHGGRLGGKRLRPALLLLTAKAIGKVTHDHHVLGAVVEMIHLATLVHDDVLDEADVRRHVATVNAKWNNETSVLLGDYLFTHAFHLASTIGTAIACQTIGRATNIVCEGELRQTGNQGRLDVSEEEYNSIISAKTAELCACSCNLGATFADASEDIVEAMTRYGRNLGIAFQIADDLLDLVGDEHITGKSLGTDLEKQKPTLPIIHVWQKASESERLEIGEILKGSSVDRRLALNPWFERFGALDYATSRAREFAEAALRELDPLPPSPAKDVLIQITHFVVSRSR
jgi:octaprenyl-diphosphate synthase